MTTLAEEYQRILQSVGLSGRPEWLNLHSNDAETWLVLGRAVRVTAPDDALWCFKTAMDLDGGCYAATEAAGDIMASRGEHLKAAGYYSAAYSPSLLNASAIERLGEQMRLAGMHDFHPANVARFAERIRRRSVPDVHLADLHHDVVSSLKVSGIGNLSRPASHAAEFASAAAYDVYRLPDGRRNPTKGPNRTFHATFAPEPQDIALALRRLLLPLFEESEEHLLAIPIVAVDVFHVFPLVLLHPTYGPVIVVPLGTFGSLFAVNEILVLAQSVEGGGRSLFEASAATLRTFLTGHGEVDELRALMPLVIRPEVDPVLNLHVWKRTVIHQTFMLLHEFGHIALGHITQRHRSKSFTGLFSKAEGDGVLWFPGTSDHETAADTWAAKHLQGGIPGVEYAKGGIGWIDEELKELFALVGFLGLVGDTTNQLHATALARWSSVAGQLSLLHMMAPKVMERRDRDQFSDLTTYLSRFVEHPSVKSIERLRTQT